MKNTENQTPEIEGLLTRLFKLLDMFTVSFASLNSRSSSGNDRSFCSIIRFLNIIQNSTKPWEREDSACILFKQMFPLYWTELLKINTPWKEGTEPSSFYASSACTDAERPHLQIQSPTWESCQRLEYKQWTSCYWTALRNSSVPTYFGSLSMSQ